VQLSLDLVTGFAKLFRKEREQMPQSHGLQVFAAASTVLALAGIASADVTLSDTEFVPSNWGLETAILGAGGTSSGLQVSGGNPGFAREMTNTANSGGTIYGFSRFGTTTATRYEPAVQGAILSVDYSIDARWLSGAGGDGHSIMFGAKQGTFVYFADVDITGSSGAWTTHGALGLTAAAFQPLTTGAPINFSASGAPLRFGFIVGNTAPGGGYTNVVMYDNFNVTIHNVPAPGVLGLAGLCGVLTFRRRR
jgi:opacity protein-like surface antigen